MAKMSMKIVGTNELIKNLQAAGPRGVKAIGCGLYLVGNNIMTEAKEECPVDTGAMKNSGYVTLPVISGQNVTVECGFGGASKLYCVRQHEDVMLNHPGGGNAKFLQNPLYRAKGSLWKDVANYAERAFSQNKGSTPSGTPTEPR